MLVFMESLRDIIIREMTSLNQFCRRHIKGNFIEISYKFNIETIPAFGPT